MSHNLEPLSSRQSSSKGDIATIADLRKEANELIQTILSGKADYAKVRAFVPVANVVLNTLKVEIQYIKTISKTQTIPFIPDETKLLT